MNAFTRDLVQVDIPPVSLEIVPEDEAERLAWQRKREALAECRLKRLAEEDDLRMQAMRRYERDLAKPWRKAMRWALYQWHRLMRRLEA